MKKTRYFVRNLLLIVLACAVFAAINLLVMLLPEKILRTDTSSSGLYTFSEQTLSLIEKLEDDIDVFYVCASGQQDSVIELSAQHYCGLSDKLSFHWRDPAAYPAFTSQYTESDVNDNSFIVVMGANSVLIPYTDVYVLDYEKYLTSGAVEYSYDVENQLTSAVMQLTKNSTISVAMTSGHGEDQMSVGIQTTLKQQGFEFSNINLRTESDLLKYSCVMIFNPRADLTFEECGILGDYLSAGGRLMVVTDYINTGRPNLERLLSSTYGVESSNGVVFEGSSEHCIAGYPFYLLPRLIKHSTTRPLISANYVPVIPIAHGIKLNNESETAVSELFMKSSTMSYLKDPYTMTSYEPDQGSDFAEWGLGAACLDKASNSRMVWFTSELMFDDDAIRQSSGANEDIVINSFGWLCEIDDIISIHPKAMGEEKLSVSSSQSKLYSLIVIGIVPLLFIGAGVFVLVMRRRKK